MLISRTGWRRFKYELAILLVMTPMLMLFQNCGEGFSTLAGDLNGSSGLPPVQSGDKMELKTLAQSGFGNYSCGISLSDEVICWGLVGTQAYVLGTIPGAVEAASHNSSICARTAAGSVYCTTYVSGETRPEELYKLHLVTTLAPVTQLTSSAMNICGLTTANKVYCWGYLAFGGTPGQKTPVEIPELAGVKKIAGSLGRICGITAGNSVVCVDSAGSNMPVIKIFPTLTNIVDIEGSGSHGNRFCAQNSAGELYCTTAANSADDEVVEKITGLAPIRAFSFDGAGRICAIQNDDRIMCWGPNGSFELSQSYTLEFTQPTEILRLPGVKDIEVYASSTCMVTASNTVRCFGNGVDAGDDGVRSSSKPFAVPEFTPYKQIQFSGYYTNEVYGLRSNGAVDCRRTRKPSYRPYYTDLPSYPCPESTGDTGFASFNGLGGVKQLAATGYRTCALLGSGGVTCWGRDVQGPILTPVPGTSPVMYQVMGVSQATQIAVVGGATCALLTSGQVSCWGNLGDVNSSTPAVVSGLSNIVKIVGGYETVYALSNSGVVSSIGWSQISPTPTTGERTVTTVPITGVKQLENEGYSACAVKTDGTVWCWFTPGSFGPYDVPVQVPGMSDIQKIVAAEEEGGGPVLSRICGSNSLGKVFCVGANFQGQQGLGHTRPVPTAVESNFTSIDSLILGDGISCEKTGTATMCVGSKPFWPGPTYLGNELTR